MAAPKGNQFWLARSTHGRKPIFASPEDLYDSAVQYFQWCEDNPLQEEKLFCHQGEITKGTVNLMRAMTIGGLCLFMDISHDAWLDYKGRKDFIGVTKAIDETIRDQKFSGAAAGLLNANIIARDLGLSDKVDNTLTGADGGPVQITAIEIVAPQMDKEE